jgi:hypothetical protein
LSADARFPVFLLVCVGNVGYDIRGVLETQGLVIAVLGGYLLEALVDGSRLLNVDFLDAVGGGLEELLADVLVKGALGKHFFVLFT